MPACQAKRGCFSMYNTFGGGLDEEEVSCNAIAIAREAGPKPIQIRSWMASGLSGEREIGVCGTDVFA